MESKNLLNETSLSQKQNENKIPQTSSKVSEILDIENMKKQFLKDFSFFSIIELKYFDELMIKSMYLLKNSGLNLTHKNYKTISSIYGENMLYNTLNSPYFQQLVNNKTIKDYLSLEIYFKKISKLNDNQIQNIVLLSNNFDFDFITLEKLSYLNTDFIKHVIINKIPKKFLLTLSDILYYLPDFKFNFSLDENELLDDFCEQLFLKIPNKTKVEFENSKSQNILFGKDISQILNISQSNLPNCFLVNGVGALISNPHFLNKFINKLEIINDSKNSKFNYKISNQTQVSLSLSELYSYKNLDKLSPITYLESLDKNTLQELINNFIKLLHKNTQNFSYNKKSYSKKYPLIPFEKYDTKLEGRFRQIQYNQDILSEVDYQIKNQTGEFYKAFLFYVKSTYRKKILNGKLGAKILAGIFYKNKLSQEKLDFTAINGGNIAEVFSTFLDDDWIKNFGVGLNNNIVLKNYIYTLLLKLNNNPNLILTCCTKTDENLSKQPYFLYENKLLAYNHSYTICGYNKNKNELILRNPWKYNQKINIKFNDFFELFSAIDILVKKQKMTI